MSLLRSLRRGLAVTPAWLLMLANLIVELLKSTWATLRMVYAPRDRVRPGILAVPTELQSSVAITTMANMITLTPGTTTLDVEVSEHSRLLYVHALDVDPDKPETTAQGMRDAFEPSINKVWP